MRVPAAACVGPHVYEVRSDERTIRDLQSDERLGRCAPADLVIDIDPRHPSTVVADTLLHEILHACVSLVGLGEVLGDDEEQVVTALAPAVLDVLRSNPELVAFCVGASADAGR